MLVHQEIIHALHKDRYHHHLLAVITTMNQGIQLTHPLIQVTHSGMGSSVKVPAAVVPSLPQGSVYSYPPTQPIALNSCVSFWFVPWPYATMSTVVYTFNTNSYAFKLITWHDACIIHG